MATDPAANPQLEQLHHLRESLRQSTLTHFRRELAKTLPTDQVLRIVDHQNVSLELNRLIQRVSLESHPNLDSLSFKIAQGLTQVAEPHVRLAVSLSNPNLKPEDILQDVIKNNADVRAAYEPLSDSLKPAAPNSSVSKLYQQLASPLVVDPHHLPTLKPEIDKVVSLGSSESDPTKQQQISEQLHQDLLAEVLTHQQPTLTNSRQIIKTYLQTHGLNTNQIDNQSFNQFVDYFNKYQEVVSSDQGVATLQLVSEVEKISPKDLQSILSQSNQTPESLIQEISTTPVSPPTTPPSEPALPAVVPPVRDVGAAIDAADHHSYTSASSVSSQPFNVRQIIQFIRRYFSEQSSPQPNFIQTIVNFFRGTPTEVVLPNGSPLSSSFGSSVGDFAKQGLSQAGQAIGSAVKQGVQAAVKAATQAAKAAIQAAGKSAAQFAAKALFLNPYFWIAVVAIILVVAVLYMVAGASPQKVALMQTDSISGLGGSSSGTGIGYCDPASNPEECTPLFCQGTCACPVSGVITQGPGGSFSHQSANAIDIGLTNGDPVYSISAGTVSFAGFSTAGYGNLVIVDNPDGTQLYYAHLESYFVIVGQAVAVREQLGTGDDTGNSTGPHLHLEYRGSNTQNILNLFNFTEEQKNVLNGCSENCGGISCQN